MELKYAKDTSKTNEDIEYKFGVWYPIDSAPKDGIKILITDGVMINISKYSEQYKCFVSSDRWITKPTKWMLIPIPE